MSNDKKALLAEINDLKKENSNLRDKVIVLSAFSQIISDPAFLINDQGIILNANYSFSALHHKDPQEIIGLNIFKIIPESTVEKCKSLFKKALKDKKPLIFESEDDGNVFENFVQPIPDKSGKITGLNVVSIDITQSKKTEQELKDNEKKLNESESYYRTIFENTGSATFIAGEDNTILQMNSECVDLLGYGRETIEGKRKWMELLLPKYRNILQQSGNYRNPNTYEFQIKDARGNIKDINMNMAQIPRTKSSVASLTDITEINKVLGKLAESEKLYRTLSESVEEFIFIINSEDNVEYINEYSARKLGIERKNLINQPRWKLFPSKTYDLQSQSLQIVFELGETLKKENMIEINETEIWMETLLIPLKNEKGGVDKVLGVARDITERKNYEILIERQNDILKGMGNILQETIGSVTRDQLAQTCLKVCEDITNSEFGFISEVNSEKRLATLAVSQSLHGQCNLGEVDIQPMLEKLNIHQAWEQLLKDKRSLIFNKPIVHQEEVPHDHFPMKNHMLVPLIREGEVVGMIGLANKESGYNLGDRNAVEALSTTVVEALMRKNAEYALKETSEQLELIIKTSPLAIISLDLEGKVKTWNPAAEQIFGWCEMEVMGKSLPPVPRKFSEQFLDNYPKILNSGIVTMNMAAQRKDGKQINIELSTGPLYDAENSLIGAVGIIADVTERKKMEKELRDSEEKFREMAEKIHEIFYIFDPVQRKMLYISPAHEKITGWSVEKIYHDPETWIKMIIPEDRDKLFRYMYGETDAIGQEGVEFRIRKPDGTIRWLLANPTLLKDDSGIVFRVMGSMSDITSRKEAEEKLSRSRENLRKILSSVSFGIIIVGKDKKIRHVNKTALDMVGYKSESDLVGQTCHNTLCPSLEHQCPILDMDQCLDKSERILLDKEGNEIPIIKSAIPIVMDGEEVILESFIDITALKRAEKALEGALEDKEMLMKEIYHRMKNNLMVISSLLNLQSDYITDEEARGIFKDSQKRAHSMALIHERLYRSTDLKHIDFGDYIRTLVMDLFRTYLAEPSRIKLELDVEDVMLDIDTAIPLGLIVNELLSNSMKHAFPDSREGTIKLDFKSDNEGCLLLVSDDGIGLPNGMDISHTETLGLQLVNSLIGQIDAKMEINNQDGTEFRISLKQEKLG
jgi:PAS domain S-box-containing protein